MAGNYEVIGKQKVKTKAGKDFFNYYLARPFNDYENENSECIGRAVETEGSSLEFMVKPGDLVKLSYSKGFQGKATLSGMEIVKSAVK